MSRINVGQDPDIWIMDLLKMKRKLKYMHNVEIIEYDLMIHITTNMTKCFDGLACYFENQILSEDDPLKYDQMISLLCS